MGDTVSEHFQTADIYLDSPGTNGTLKQWTGYALDMKHAVLARDKHIVALWAELCEAQGDIHEVVMLANEELIAKNKAEVALEVSQDSAAALARELRQAEAELQIAYEDADFDEPLTFEGYRAALQEQAAARAKYEAERRTL